MRWVFALFASLVLSLGVLGAQEAPSQTASAYGVVLGANDVPLAGVSVTVGNQKTVTDDTGAFKVAGLTPGTIRVVGSAKEYFVESVDYVFKPGENKRLTIRLHKEPTLGLPPDTLGLSLMSVAVMRYDPVLNRVYIGFHDGTTRFLTTSYGGLSVPSPTSRSPIRDLAQSPDGTNLAIVAEPDVVRFQPLVSGPVTPSLPLPGVEKIVFINDQTLLAADATGKLVKVDVKSRKVLESAKAIGGKPLAVLDVDRERKVAMTYTVGGPLEFWSIKHLTPRSVPKVTDVEIARLLPNGKEAVVWYRDHHCSVVSVGSGDVIRDIGGVKGVYAMAAVAPNQIALASESTVTVYDTGTGRIVSQYNVATAVNPMVASPDYRYLILSASDGRFIRWRLW